MDVAIAKFIFLNSFLLWALSDSFRYKETGDISESVYNKMTSLVNPLANPKGVQLECEICRKPAHLLCTLCRVTYYW